MGRLRSGVGLGLGWERAGDLVDVWGLCHTLTFILSTKTAETFFKISDKKVIQVWINMSLNKYKIFNFLSDLFFQKNDSTLACWIKRHGLDWAPRPKPHLCDLNTTVSLIHIYMHVYTEAHKTKMHMQHRQCLWRRKGSLWIMPFKRESLLILFLCFGCSHSPIPEQHMD